MSKYLKAMALTIAATGSMHAGAQVGGGDTLFINGGGSGDSHISDERGISEEEYNRLIYRPQQEIAQEDILWRYIRLKHEEILSSGSISHSQFDIDPADQAVLIEVIETFYPRYSDDTERVFLMCADFGNPDNELQGQARAANALRFMETGAERSQKWRQIEAQFLAEVRQELGPDVLEGILNQIAFERASTSSMSVKTTREILEEQGMDVSAYVSNACKGAN